MDVSTCTAACGCVWFCGAIYFLIVHTKRELLFWNKMSSSTQLCFFLAFIPPQIEQRRGFLLILQSFVWIWLKSAATWNAFVSEWVFLSTAVKQQEQRSCKVKLPASPLFWCIEKKPEQLPGISQKIVTWMEIWQRLTWKSNSEIYDPHPDITICIIWAE